MPFPHAYVALISPNTKFCFHPQEAFWSPTTAPKLEEGGKCGRKGQTLRHGSTKLLETRQKKNPLVTKKKEFKTDRLPKRACCVLVYFFLDISNFKIKSRNDSYFLLLAVLFVFYPSAFNPRRRRHYLNTFLTPPVLFLTYPTAYRHYLIVCTSCVKS